MPPSTPPRFLRFPVIAKGAEHLTRGYLMRRNILAYEAPPNNEGYDLICIHPDPRHSSKVVRVQVKSRYATDSDRTFMVREASFGTFDFIILVSMNVGYFYEPSDPAPAGREAVELLVLPPGVARRLYKKAKSGWNRIHTRGHNLDRYKNERGIEQIAKALRIPYPCRSASR